MLYELRYLNYRDFGGVKFPTTLHIHQGDPRLVVPHNSMEVTLSNVQPNSGGLRTYLAQGATVVTHQANKEFLENVLFSPGVRTMMPDRFSTYHPYLSGGRRPLPMETVNQKYVISGRKTSDR